MSRALVSVPLALSLLLASCGKAAVEDKALEQVLAARQARLDSAMTGADSGGPVARWILPDRLAEISGLTVRPDGRLFAHDDETGRIWEIDYRRGQILKEFTLGPPVVLEDFEAIAAVADTFWMLTSAGTLYTFGEGEDGGGTAYRSIDTGLRDRCQFEGMAYDSTASELLLACKNVEDGGANDTMLIFRWPLDQDSATTLPEPIAVPVTAIVGDLGWDKIEPSDITVDPRDGSYLVVASGQQLIFAVTRTGEVLFSRTLPEGHDQPEGLAITPDHLILLSDEANTGPAVITAYRRLE